VNCIPAARRAKNSIVVGIVTDAPLQAHQLSLLTRRTMLGISRYGGTANRLSGEFVLASSPGYRVSEAEHRVCGAHLMAYAGNMESHGTNMAQPPDFCGTD
jgi:L-aminopeptidase/D-esterase-like protein